VASVEGRGRSQIRKWHQPDRLGGSGDVRSSGWTGSAVILSK
jgi:hypothetical protein